MPKAPATASKARPRSSPSPSSPAPVYRRILLKLSGEAFSKPGVPGLDTAELAIIARELQDVAALGVQVAVVVGGGNFVRGAELAKHGGIDQGTADQMGMLATVINALALKEKLLELGAQCRVMSAIEIRAVAEPFIRGRAVRHMEKGRIIILAAGTGNPFFTTDTCAALRATELSCDILLKATKVDGVYSADPKRNPDARRFDHLTFAHAIERRLGVMDITALAMCQEHGVPVLVFDFQRRGNIARVVRGERLGTLLTVSPQK